MQPKLIVATLNAEDGEALRDAGEAEITMRDLREFKDYLDNLESVEIRNIVRGNADEKRTAARIYERIDKTLNLMTKIEDVTADVLNDFQDARYVWRENPIDAKYPTALLNSLLSVAKENRQIVRDFQENKAVQAFVQSATVNVHQAGVSQRDMFFIVRQMASLLDLPLDRVMSAFTEAQEMLSTRNGPIDVDAVEANA